jgi:DNA-binding PadR family transcriptional regulator
MEIIEKGTDGQWKPSPGSVYPLLAWLQEGKYTKEIPTEESGMKRYRLTEKGKSFLKEQNTLRENLQKKLEFFAPPIFSSFLLGTHPESFKIIREAEKRFIKALFNLRRALEINLSREIAEEIRDFLNNSTDMIEELCTKIKGRSS